MYLYLMHLSRNIFFLLLLMIFDLPWVGYKFYWLVRSQRTMGVMCFTGHTLETIGLSSHPVIRYKAGKDSLFLNGNANFSFKEGELVPVRYQTDTPSDARIDIPLSIWGDTLAWCLYPLLVILVLFLTPAKLDPLIPVKAGIQLNSKKPFIHIISPKTPRL
jgi:hypothetical protein